MYCVYKASHKRNQADNSIAAKHRQENEKEHFKILSAKYFLYYARIST